MDDASEGASGFVIAGVNKGLVQRRRLAVIEPPTGRCISVVDVCVALPLDEAVSKVIRGDAKAAMLYVDCGCNALMPRLAERVACAEESGRVDGDGFAAHGAAAQSEAWAARCETFAKAAGAKGMAARSSA